MAIEKEPNRTEQNGYEKTVLSELQGAWQNLRDEVAEQAGFPDYPSNCHSGATSCPGQ